MDMISPEQYINKIVNLSKEELLNEKIKLETRISELENDIKNNTNDYFCGGRETEVSVSKMYLLELENLISKK